MSTHHAPIFEFVSQCCRPLALESPWGFVEPDTSCLQLAEPMGDLQRALSEAFSLEELLGSGVVLQGDSNEPRLNPRLSTSDGRLVVLRNREGTAFDLLTSEGVCSDHVPLFTLLEDAKTRQSIESCHKTLFVVFSMDDLILLRQLGFAAAPATCLDRLSHRGLRSLGALVGLGLLVDPCWTVSSRLLAPAYDAVRPDGYMGRMPDCYYPIALVFVAGSLFTPSCEIPVALGPVARFVSGADQFLDLVLDEMYVWWPTQEDIEHLRYCLQIRHLDSVRRFVKKERKLFQLAEFVDPSSPPSRSEQDPDFAGTLCSLVTLESDGANNGVRTDRLRNVRETYNLLVEQTLFHPLIETALAAEDPVEANQRVLLASIFKQLHRMMPTLEIEFLMRTRNGRYDAGTDLAPDKLIQQIEKSMNMTKKILDQMAPSASNGWGT